MPASSTARRAERLATEPNASLVPVAALRPGDFVADMEGDLHPLATVSPAHDGSVWIQRKDLDYREHVHGSMTVVRPRPLRSNAD
jgi:hypothetical protein